MANFSNITVLMIIHLKEYFSTKISMISILAKWGRSIQNFYIWASFGPLISSPGNILHDLMCLRDTN
jgi:hypothetical protein